MTTPQLYEAACKGTHLPDDDGSDENFVYGGSENADGPAVRTGAWIADVTYDEPSSAPPFGQPVTFTATASNSEPVTHAGWGPWEDSPSLSEDLGIAWVSGDGGTRDHGNNDAVLKNIMISSFSGGDSSSETEPWTAIATAESGGDTEAHAPHGEDSLGLWQINIDPAQTDNPDTFDCSEIVQWASGTAVRTGAIADVTYERAASQPESANNLKQSCSPYTPSMLASAASTSALKTPRQPAPHQTTRGDIPRATSR